MTRVLRPMRLLIVSVVAVVNLAGLVVVVLQGGTSGEDWVLGMAAVMIFAVGALLVIRVPGNRVSWTLLAAALGFGLMLWGELSVGAVADALGGIGLFGLVLPVLSVFVPLWFPTGDALSQRWRWVGWLAGGGVVAVLGGTVVVALVEQGDYGSIGTCTSVGTCAGITGIVIWLVAATAAVASFVVRWIRSKGVERLQLRWLVPAFLVFAVGIIAEFGGFQDTIVANVLLPAGLLLIPVAIAVAILRYRLYEIDRFINRTIVYGVVVGLLFATYAGGVFLLRGMLPGEQSDLAVAASTLAVAALFAPLRRRVQRWVDRRFYRSRYDARLVVEGFTARMRDEVDLDALTAELAGLVQETVRPVSVAVWVRES